MIVFHCFQMEACLLIVICFRYVVHKKLVNFTAPDDKHAWTEEAKNELFSSLFGGTNVSTEG